ncbi:MAG: hypothetical protein QGF09_15460 [Rhodospirillales bacterium]|nr:hypothetical protein [Rhodospirillales bacterium]
MNCPDCQNGKIPHPFAQVTSGMEYARLVPCGRCHGSGVARIDDKYLVELLASLAQPISARDLELSEV